MHALAQDGPLLGADKPVRAQSADGAVRPVECGKAVDARLVRQAIGC